jgi:putative membrane protein
VSFWCQALREPWSWQYRAYPGVWLVAGLLAFAYFRAVWRRHRRTGAPIDRRRALWFALGWVVLWLATDWPLATLGASYLASAHMVQYMLYTLVAAPLLVLGTPEWMARRVVERLRLYRTMRFLARPVVAAIAFNVVLLVTHTPIVVDNVRTTQIGGFALDLLWLASGVILWQPLISPLPELIHKSFPVRMVYLFIAAGVFAMIPGGFLTFSSFPLYRTYELAPRIQDFAALSDQQLAGAIMKIGNIPIVWTVMAVLFFRWATLEREGPPARKTVRPTDRAVAPASGGSDGSSSPGTATA